jgi:ABC-type nickel/cobalt efflux system permease component RcnA
MKAKYCALIALSCCCLMAHPMGNFSINHYTKIDLSEHGPQLTYILDFAEIPTSELFNDWGNKDASSHAAVWASGLTVTINSHRTPVTWRSVESSTLDGAGGMPVLRVVMKARLPSEAGAQLTFQDGNYANRTGWKEVVITHAPGVHVESATQTDRDLSKALTVYPADLTQVPPQDLTASVSWRVNVVNTQPAVPKPAIIVQPAPAPKPFSTQQPTAAGTVERGDYLSRMLKQKQFGLSAILIGLVAAFGLGAMHALSPGHGKTIVAAYLVGSRGTLKHAGILGLTVTFTHTISVFLLGLGVLFFQKYVIPERIVPVLGAISGLSIVVIGAYLLYQRTMALALAPQHHHSHSHSHSHSHAGHSHSHAMPESITMGSLLGLGVSGGLVPCPSALILLLSAISLGQVALGLGLLAAFSTGLAFVLIAIGGVVVYGKSLLPKSSRLTNHPALRLLPVFSSVVVIVLGLLMTLTATGVIQPLRL